MTQRHKIKIGRDHPEKERLRPVMNILFATSNYHINQIKPEAS